MINKQQLFLGIFLSAFGTFVFADHPTVAFGAESAGPISTISAVSTPVGGWGFGLRSEIINNDAFRTEQLEDFAASGLEGVHSIDRITSTSLSVSYGVTDKLSVNARLPYIKRENIREGEIEDGVPEAHTHGDSSGLGDLNGETRGKNEIAGIKDENSGGSIVFLSPGVRVSSGKFGGFISVGMPVIEDQNGKQTDIDTRIVAGVWLAI